MHHVSPRWEDPRTVAGFVEPTSGVVKLGAVAAFVAVDAVPHILPYALVLAASSFLYVAMADLIPDLHKGRTDASSLRQIALIGLGILTVVLFSE